MGLGDNKRLIAFSFMLYLMRVDFWGEDCHSRALQLLTVTVDAVARNCSASTLTFFMNYEFNYVKREKNVKDLFGMGEGSHFAQVGEGDRLKTIKMALFNECGYFALERLPSWLGA